MRKRQTAMSVQYQISDFISSGLNILTVYDTVLSRIMVLHLVLEYEEPTPFYTLKTGNFFRDGDILGIRIPDVTTGIDLTGNMKDANCLHFLPNGESRLAYTNPQITVVELKVLNSQIAE